MNEIEKQQSIADVCDSTDTSYSVLTIQSVIFISQLNFRF
jgi:hypothetical protein